MENTSSHVNENKQLCSVSVTNDDIGIVLSSTPPIVENILKNFCIEELKLCGQVCKLWYNVSQVIRKQRKDIFRIFKVFPRKKYGYDPHIIVCDDESQSWIARNKFHIGDHFCETLKSAQSEPLLAIIFCSEELFNKPEKYFRDFQLIPYSNVKYRKRQRLEQATDIINRKYYNEPLIDFIGQKLPNNCRILSCAALGIVGTPTNNLRPLEAEASLGLSAVFIPSLPEVEVYQFNVLSNYDKAMRKKINTASDKICIPELTGIPEDKTIKCLLIFFRDNPDKNVISEAIIQYYLEKQNYQIALGGTVIDHIASPIQKCESWPICTGLAFTGNSVRVASIVLEQHVKTKEDIEEKLRQLKSCNIPESKCIAFMFACCGRGADFYNMANVEADMFHKIFPKVPLFGIFGRGEIGIEFLPSFVKQKEKFHINPKMNRTQKQLWYHGYTSIFVLISLQN